tara:strand:+ start:5000 stop:7909 length:2910 start_codon:yes stop_codon:yes gene_type:complete
MKTVDIREKQDVSPISLPGRPSPLSLGGVSPCKKSPVKPIYRFTSDSTPRLRSVGSGGYGGAPSFTNGWAVHLDGANDHISVTPSSSIQLYGVSVWFKCDDIIDANTVSGVLLGLGGTNWIFGLGGDLTSGLDNEIISVHMSGHRYGYCSPTDTISAGWHNAIAAWSTSSATTGGDGYDIYLDGVKIGTEHYSQFNTAPSIYPLVTSEIRFGERFGIYPYGGLIDEISIFDSLLSASDISDIYNNGLPGDLENLDPAGWWRCGDFESGQGTTIKDQGREKNDGTLKQGASFSTDVINTPPTPPTPPTISPAWNGNAYSVELNGTNGYVGVTNMVNQSLGALSMWVNITSANGIHSNGAIGMLAGFGPNTGSHGNLDGLNWGYGVANTDLLTLRANSSIVAQYSVPSAGDKLSAGWHHIVMTHNGTGYTFYIDGVIATSAPLSDGSTGGNITTAPYNILTGSDFTSLKIGGNNANTFYSQGLFDEVAVFDSALSASDISAIYNDGVPNDISSFSPTHWWRMGDNQDFTVIASDGYTITGKGTRPDGNIFDGNTDSIIASSGAGVPLEIEFTNPIPVTTLRLYLPGAGYDYGVVNIYNGSTLVGTKAEQSNMPSGWYTIALSQSAFTKIEINRASNGYGSGIAEIEVDGKTLTIGTQNKIPDKGIGVVRSNATLQSGTAFSTNVPTPPPAWNGNAYSVELDGTGNNVIDAGNITSINSASNISISGWFYASSFPHNSFNSLWGGGAGTDQHSTRFWLSCNNGSEFTIYFGTSTNFTFPYSILTETWYHVVFTLDGSTAKLYVNGSQAGSTVTTAPSLTSESGNNFEFGGNPTYRPYLWDGLIDETAIFNSTLSDSDITSMYNDGTPKDISSLNPVGWWRMGDNDGGSGTIITDQGSDNDATIQSGMAFSTNVPSGSVSTTGTFVITIFDTEENILNRTGDETGTVAFGTDTKDLYILNTEGFDKWSHIEDN